jgi:ELWxxDGT repeat protein
MRHLAVVSLLAFLALPAAGLEPYLVKDINPVPDPADSAPSDLVTLGGAVLFFAHDGGSGRDLWRSDGTPEGTWLVSEICPPDDGCFGESQAYLLTERLYFFLAPGEPGAGTTSLWVTDGTSAGTLRLSDPPLKIRPRKLWVAGQGVLYFVAEDQDHGSELWRTDGTPAGTWLVADVRPGPEGSEIGGLAAYKGRLWFFANDGHRGGALWRTDGTPAGTVLALDPVPSSDSHPPPQDIWVIGSRLAFFAPTPARGNQLWAGDGTAKGTAPVTALSADKSPSVLLDAVVRGNRLWFVAQDRKGQELWLSDGTGRGTRVLTAFPNAAAFRGGSPGIFYSIPLPRQQPAGNRFVFQAYNGSQGIETWTSDGTPKGTRLLRDLGSTYLTLDVLQGRLYLVAYDGSGPRLWSTDGTEAGTRRVADLCSCFLYFAAETFNLGTRLLFLTGNGQFANTLWSTDGTAAGTGRVTDSEQTYRGPAAVLNGKLLFGLADGLHGTELWRTDGTAAGTQLIRDINQIDLGGSYPHSLRAFGDEVVFVAQEDIPGLWKSDGTEPGTSRIRTLGPHEVPSPVELEGASGVAGGRLFFFQHGVLWRTDGTESGTFPLPSEGVDSGCCSPEVRIVGSTAFFSAREVGESFELWASDGTTEGTRQVRDIEPGPSGSYPYELTAFQGKLFFSAETSESGRELWRSDGTEAGTVQIKDINPTRGSDPRHLTVHAGRLWFFADDGEHGEELWTSDGTEAGTHLAVDLEPGFGSFRFDFLIPLGDKLLLSGGQGLWVTDGTPAGTRKISAEPVRWSPFHVLWTLFQGRLYYVPDRREALWTTDGTEAGTRPLLDRDGMEIENVEELAPLGDRLLFTTREAGTPLWASDGTPEGTFRIHGSTGGELLTAGSRVFFGSYDRATGWELWAIRP